VFLGGFTDESDRYSLLLPATSLVKNPAHFYSVQLHRRNVYEALLLVIQVKPHLPVARFAASVRILNPLRNSAISTAKTVLVNRSSVAMWRRKRINLF